MEISSVTSTTPTTTQITKAKTPPIWVGQSFERFRLEIEDWSRNNKDSEYNKYNDLIESLKKNDRIREYVITVVIDRTDDQNLKKVQAVLNVLAEKYEKTKAEKCNDIMERIVSFSTEKSESCEKFLLGTLLLAFLPLFPTFHP